jgi:hypothetical protein
MCSTLSRRAFLQQTLRGTAAAALAGVGRTTRAAEAQAVKSQPDVIVYAGTYPGWPWITAGADGALYCAFREGTEHGFSAVGKALLCRSTDQGRTWSPAQTIVDAPDVDDRNVAVVELPNRALLVTYNTYTRAGESLAMTVRSSDGGKTWSAPQPVGEPNTRTKAAAVPLADGTLLLPFYIAPGNGSLAGLSRDQGRTWKVVRVPDTDGFVGDEWDVLEVEAGRLIGIIRNSHRTSDGTFWKTESRDGGRSWAVPRPTNVRSQRHTSPAHIARHGRTPVLVYADRRMVSVSMVRTSDPQYLRWDVEHQLPCFRYNADESPIPDGSYPVSVQTGPRERLIVDYEIRSDAKRIAGYFVELPEAWTR